MVQCMWFGLFAGRCTVKVEAGKNCTLCYRCVNRCPAQAITLLGKRVVKQNDITKYVV